MMNGVNRALVLGSDDETSSHVSDDLGSAAEHREVFTDGRSTPKQQDRNNVHIDEFLEKPLKNRVKLNICGLLFETYKCTLQEYPQTLLGGSELDNYYDPNKNEYFFDRNRESFSYILNFYQTGRLYAPSHVPPDIFEAEREFYKINLALRQKTAAQNGTKKIVAKKSRWEKIANKVWKFLNNPKSSKAATVWAWLDIAFIMVSVTCLIVETLPEIKLMVSDNSSREYKILFTLDTICVGFFTFDLIARGVTAPDKKGFLTSLMSWLDFLAILPYFVLLFTKESNNTIEILRVLRLARVLRVFKLVRRSKKLLLIAHVMKKSTSELSLLVMVWLMAVVVFGSFLYYAENGKNENITSILGACWWAVATMSTVGYGDVYPKTTWGKVIGTVVVFLSMIFLALPLTIIVSTFSKTYRARKCLTADDNTDEDDDDEEEKDDANGPVSVT
ncbi:potassium voltage-gated channel subfamily A member 1-like isoform X4 [Bolinopsis microptera]|uniref:potassium voltage-gated channel subfamily A member 1-like isoform X4 n=1 Tax=Bolinopsis microptera TaxID=2820187 RepID=UPI00307A0A71